MTNMAETSKVAAKGRRLRDRRVLIEITAPFLRVGRIIRAVPP
ncbi:hypothetical protein [Streptosporangium sp. NPDC002721]